MHAAVEAEGDGQPQQQAGLLELIWSDYTYHCDLLKDPPQARLLKAPFRLFMNTSLRAQILVRLTCAAPRWAHWFFRSLLNMLHSSEVVYGAQIGPRLHLPHPYGVGIGGLVRIGSGVTLCQNVTLGSDMEAKGQPEVCDNAVLLTGAVAVGPIRIGEGAIVGANCVLAEDLPDGGLCAPARIRIVKKRINWNDYPVKGRESEVSS
jgi:serine O-acetyltransferase